MTLVRMVNSINGGKVLINLSRLAYAELKDKTIKLNLSNKLFEENNKLELHYDTRDEAEKALTLIQKELNKYYK
jgi:hypothetical protein